MNGGFGKLPFEAAARRWRTGFAACMALLLLHNSAPLAKASFGFGEPRILRSDYHLKTGHDFFADVKTDGKGKWMAVWYTADSLGGTIGADGDILFATSTDNGTTWSTPAPVNNDAATDTAADIAPALATDSNGTWLVVWRAVQRDGPNSEIYCAWFTEQSGAWSGPERVNSDFGNTVVGVVPRVAASSSGEFVCVWNSNAAVAGEAHRDMDILYSVSQGPHAWRDSAPLNSDYLDDNGAGNALVCANIATDDAGTWLVTWASRKPVAPNNGTDYNVLYSRCENNSFQWSPVAYLNTNAVGDQGDDGHRPLGPTFRAPYATSQGNGRWICVWNRLDILGSAYGADLDIMAARSVDNGISWSTPKPVNSNATSDPEGVPGGDNSPVVAFAAPDVTLVAWTTYAYAAPGIPSNGIAVARSYDFGDTWTPVAALNQNASRTPSGFHEDPTLATDQQGNWIIIWTTTQTYYAGLVLNNVFALSSEIRQAPDPPPADQDAINFILDMILGRTELDANHDGKIDLADVIAIRAGTISPRE